YAGLNPPNAKGPHGVPRARFGGAGRSMKAIKVNRSKAILSRDRTRVLITFLPCCERPALALAQTMLTQHDEALVKTARFMSGSWRLPCYACIIRANHYKFIVRM